MDEYVSFGQQAGMDEYVSFGQQVFSGVNHYFLM